MHLVPALILCLLTGLAGAVNAPTSTPPKSVAQAGLEQPAGYALLGSTVTLLLMSAWVYTLRQAVKYKTAELDAERTRLKIGEETFRTLIETTSDCFWEVDASGRYTYLSPTFQEITGYAPGDFIGRTAIDLLPEAQIDPFRERLITVLEAHQPIVSFQQPIRHRDGRLVIVESSGVPLIGPGGELRGMRGIARDITGRVRPEEALIRDTTGNPADSHALVTDITDLKQAEERLRQSEERLRLAIDSAELGIWDWDLSTGGEIWSDRCKSQLGYPLDGQSSYADFLSSALHPDDHESVDRLVRRSLELVEDYSAEYRVIWPDGSLHWIGAAGRVYPGADGRAARMGGITQDITERKQAEQNLRDSERRFRQLFEHLPLAYQSLDIQGRWLDANQKMAELLGFDSPEPLLGREFVDFWDDSLHDRFAANQAAFKTSHTIEGELPLRRRDGSPVTVMIAGRIQRDAAGHFLCAHYVLTDISERRAMEEAIRELNADLERKVEERTAEALAANMAKSEFLAHMSHEIRTPLNAVLGLAQLLAREPLAENQYDMVGRIRAAGQSLLAIINDLLDLSKIEAGQLRIEPHPFDLGTLLTKVEGLMGPAAQAKGVALCIEESPVARRTLVGDALRLEQVLINLVGNAIKFTERGTVTLQVQVLGTGAPTLCLRFAVRDTGIGIAPEALAGLFMPFTQADAGITRRFGGTGLGLSICKRLVEMMDGEIGVESQLGQGSTFWFQLNLVQAGADTTPTPLPCVRVPERPPASGPRLAGLNLLVVDDSAMNRDLLERVLILEGATATLAADGQLAMEILRTRPLAFDAVLMDVQMPVMDGLTATRLIRTDRHLTELPVIALTAGVLSHQQEAARAAGVNDVLPKPLDLEQMISGLLQWVSPRPELESPWLAAAETDPKISSPTSTINDDSAEFPDIAGIDRVRAAQTLGRNRALFRQLLEGFADEFANLVGQVQQTLDKGERETAARQLHTLRGNAGTLGALDLMASAGRLEAAIEAGETGLDARLATLGHEITALIEASRPWREAEHTVPPDPAPWQDVAWRDELCRLLHSHNTKAVRRFEELRPALMSTLGEPNTIAIGRAIRGFRFGEALAVLDQPTAGVHHAREMSHTTSAYFDRHCG